MFSAKDILGLLILVSGVMIGVLLLQQNTEYREKAASKRLNNAVTICHLESREDNLWFEMKVLPRNLQKHIDHGDILGRCPVSEPAVE